MDNLKDLAQRYGKNTAIVAGALLTGAVAYKVIKGSDPEYGGVDSHFTH